MPVRRECAHPDARAQFYDDKIYARQKAEKLVKTLGGLQELAKLPGAPGGAELGAELGALEVDAARQRLEQLNCEAELRRTHLRILDGAQRLHLVRRGRGG